MDRRDSIEPIILRFLLGTATEEESAGFLQWLQENKENRKFYFALKRIWLEKQHEGVDNEDFIENSWIRLKIRTLLQSGVDDEKEKGFGISWRKLSIAASILLLVGFSFFLGIRLKSFSGHTLTAYEIAVPMGSRSNITLPDGTNVWLNAGSSLSYASDFGLNNRVVSLSGEAYFNVEKHRGSAFLVNTQDLNIRVLGTEFNVKSYPDEDITETTIISGRVEVFDIDRKVMTSPVLLSQNQRMTYSRAEGTVVTKPGEADDRDVDLVAVPDKELMEAMTLKPKLLVANVTNVDQYTSWKDGRLIFRSESLGDLAPRLERFYSVSIEFADESIKDLTYTGTLEEVSVEKVLQAISLDSKINYRIDKNKITLSKSN